MFTPTEDSSEVRVSFPDFPEVTAYGENLNAALTTAHDILSLYLFDLEQREKPIHQPTLPHEIFVGEGQFTSTILVRTDGLTSKFNGKYSNVKTIMSSWLYIRAKQNKLDLSLLLESAVRTELGLQEPRAVYPIVEEPTVAVQNPKVSTKGSFVPFVVLSFAIVAIFLGVITFLLWNDIQERIFAIIQSNEARVPFPGLEQGGEFGGTGETGEENGDFDGTYFDQSQNGNDNNNADTEFLTIADVDEPDTIPAETEPRKPREFFLELREIFGNDDIVGQLLIQGTSIDYVVVQAADNEFYLHHDIWQNPATAGWIFLDYMADLYGGSQNTVIFGHNMAQDIMFHSLRNYRDRTFFDQNSIIRFSTLYADYIWEIFSFYQTDIAFPYTNVDFGDDWAYWLQRFADKSLHTVDVDLSQVDRILTLSTCTNSDPDGRYVIHARLVN